VILLLVYFQSIIEDNFTTTARHVSRFNIKEKYFNL